MNVHTFDLTVFFRGPNGEYTREYHNISRTALAYFLRYHRENPDYECHGSYMNR